MKSEDIEKELLSRLDDSNDYLEQMWNKGFIHGFFDGSEWRINSVWKNSTEFPEPTRLILAEVNNANANTSFMSRYNLTTSGRFSKESFARHFVRWAYVDDLTLE